MTKELTNTLKRACVSILIVILVITMMPFTSSDYEAYAAFMRGTFHYGSTVKDANGRTCSWKNSMMAPAYGWDANGNRITDQACTYESARHLITTFTVHYGFPIFCLISSIYSSAYNSIALCPHGIICKYCLQFPSVTFSVTGGQSNRVILLQYSVT